MRAAIVFFFCSVVLIVTTPTTAEETWTLTDMQGVEHDVDAVLDTGQRVVLVFWQTWCGPCKREAPELAKASLEFSDQLKFFGVVAGSDKDVNDDKVRAYVAKYKLPYAQIRDRDLTLVKQYEVKATPTILVLGEGRELLYRSHHLPKAWTTFTAPVGESR